jgi:FlaG/FlaF family flagellin (archaellin)
MKIKEMWMSVICFTIIIAIVVIYGAFIKVPLTLHTQLINFTIPDAIASTTNNSGGGQY